MLVTEPTNQGDIPAVWFLDLRSGCLFLYLHWRVCQKVCFFSMSMDIVRSVCCFYRVIESFTTGKCTFFADDLITFILPTFMYISDSTSLGEVLKMWIFIVMVASFGFGVIGLNAAHHHPEIFHSGDKIP